MRKYILHVGYSTYSFNNNYYVTLGMQMCEIPNIKYA